MIQSNSRFDSIAEAVRYIVDTMPIGYKFHGNDLKRFVVKLKPDAEFCHVDSCLRPLRKWCKHKVVNIGAKHLSHYMRVA